jgi:hypothetical protein
VFNPKLRDLARAVANARHAAHISHKMDKSKLSRNTSDTEQDLLVACQRPQLPIEQKSCLWLYSSINPIVMLVQLIPFALFEPVAQLSRFLVFLWGYHTLRTKANFTSISDSLLIPEFVVCWFIVKWALPTFWSFVNPFVCIILKWTIIGQFKPGKYPVWGPMYLKWWMCMES